MEKEEQTETLAINNLKEILNLSLPHCKDGNPNEKEFVLINRRAFECIILLKRLSSVKEFE